ncbi:unnamed protein product [Caenorhabditis brenneri]
MWNFGIKGFLTLIFLCSTVNTKKILDPEEHYYPINGSIYDRLMNSPAAKDEKDTVMGSLKSILAHIPDPSNWTSFTEVIREGKLEENIEKLGGEKSKNAVYFLQNTLKISRNKTALTGFLDACLEFVSLENVSKTEKMLIMADFLTPSEYSTWYKGSAKLADVMGVKKVFVFPQHQIDYLVKYWNETPLLKCGNLMEKLQLIVEGHQKGGPFVISELANFLQNFKNSLFFHFPFHSEKGSVIFFDGVDMLFQNLLDSKFYNFNFTTVKNIENVLFKHPEYQSNLIDRLEGTGPVLDYFTILSFQNRYDALEFYPGIFMEIVSNSTDQQLKSFTNFLRQYTSLEKSTKEKFEGVMTKFVEEEECSKIWRSQLVSKEMERMVELVSMLYEEFGIETCMDNIVDIRNIPQLNKQWNHIPELPRLTTLLSSNQSNIDALKTMLTDTKTPSKKSYVHLLTTIRSFLKEHPEFVEFMEDVQSVYGIDWEPVKKMVDPFLKYSQEQRELYIKLNFAQSNSSLKQFLNEISTENIQMMTTLKKQWTKKQMDGILGFVRGLHEVNKLIRKRIDELLAQNAERLFAEGVTDIQCASFWNDGLLGLAEPMHRAILSLEDAFGKMSCDWTAWPPK